MSDDSKGEDDISQKKQNKERNSKEQDKRKSFLSFLAFGDCWEAAGNKVIYAYIFMYIVFNIKKY